MKIVKIRFVDRKKGNFWNSSDLFQNKNFLTYTFWYSKTEVWEKWLRSQNNTKKRLSKGCLVIGTFCDGMFSDGTFSDGTFCMSTLSLNFLI